MPDWGSYHNKDKLQQNRPLFHEIQNDDVYRALVGLAEPEILQRLCMCYSK